MLYYINEIAEMSKKSENCRHHDNY